MPSLAMTERDIVEILYLPRSEGEQRLARAVMPTPFDLLEANLDVERVNLVLVLVEDEVLVKNVRILKLVTVEHLEQPRAFEQILPPLRRVLPFEIVFKDIHAFIGRRKLEAIHVLTPKCRARKIEVAPLPQPRSSTTSPGSRVIVLTMRAAR